MVFRLGGARRQSGPDGSVVFRGASDVKKQARKLSYKQLTARSHLDRNRRTIRIDSRW
ncbi:hypothetical protein AGR7C_pAt0163 [Agrobacterium deltaense Zutra 3/1]|uniref:Uncharacterized protein n=1 Tax=Agrobacterium deltaense Zutra 3/1 TaxID=1183427 RepID=A0A1S7S3F7_9HYPH|nr:hypothetical protein AGR7C_pAt0163 [Agrobacterium deltaense Zutra 3/1]